MKRVIQKNTLSFSTSKSMKVMDLNKTYNEDCLVTMGHMPNEFIDMVITSPPYDEIRNYNNEVGFRDEWNGYSFPFESIARELWRIIKKGGIVVWIVGDATINGSETLSSFKQVIFFNQIGFRIHDTMIYRKLNPQPNAGNRYQQMFEYMFVMSKGKPKTTNISLRPRKNLCGDKRTYRRKKFSRDQNGDFKENDYFIKDFVPDYNIWDFYVGGGNSTKDSIAFNHPAIFPEELVRRHLESWSNKGDLIYDPFMGSGTTAKMCVLNDRNYIGSEIVENYCDIQRTRIENIKNLNSF